MKVYIGKRPCGCVRAASVNDPSSAKLVAADVARMIESGMTVELVEGPIKFDRCPHGKPAEAAR